MRVSLAQRGQADEDRGLDLDEVARQMVALAGACAEEHLNTLRHSQADGLLRMVAAEQAGQNMGN
jgi:hypothetical protein